MKISASNIIKQKLNEASGVSRPEIKKGQLQQSVRYFKLGEKEAYIKVEDSFEFIFLKAGKGQHTVNNIRRPIAPRQVHISFPGQVHLWEVADCSGYRLLLDRILVQKYFSGASFLMPSFPQFQAISLDKAVFECCWTDLQLLLREISRPEPDCDIFKLRLELILYNISDALMAKNRAYNPKNSFTKIHPVLEQLQRILEKKFRKEKDAGFYSKGLHMTTNYLNRLCKRQWGINVKKVIDNRIVTEAIRLLLTGDHHSVREISVSLGFPNLSNFSRFFKSRTGYSPLQLRKLLRSNVDRYKQSGA